MKNRHLVIAVAAAMVLSAMPVETYAQLPIGVISGQLWENQTAAATNATFDNIPTNTADVVFTVPNGSLNFNSEETTYYTIGGFLTTGGATIVSGASFSGDVLDNCVILLTGVVSVTNESTISVVHDDGFTLQIGSTFMMSAPGQTSAETTMATYSGPSGTLPFQLFYGECCGPPAVLSVDLPLTDILQITPATGFSAYGGVGGPFTITNQSFSLANMETNSVNWSLVITFQPPCTSNCWLDASLTGGTLPAGAATNVNVWLNSNAYYLPMGIYTATVWFTNFTDGFVQVRTCSLVFLPTLAIQRTTPGLRIFAGSTTNTYDREELDTYPDGNESWVNQSFPVTYAFTLLDFPVASGFQCHLFLVPTGSLPAGNNPTNNEYVDYQASNNVWLDIAGRGTNPDGSSGYTVSLLWKTNTPNANAALEALTGGAYTNTGNQSPVGAWSLRFNNNTTGTLTPPGVAAMPFTIADPNVVNDFAAPVMALFGLQPNTLAGEGLYIDYASISITHTAYPISENFTNEPAGITTITSSGNWDTSDSANPAGVVLVNPTNDPIWVTWTLPDTGFGLGCAPFLPINAPPGYSDVNYGYNGSNSFVLPAQYNNYNDWPVTVSRAGGTNWTLIPSDCLPSYLFNGTTQGGLFYPLATNAYFELLNPPPPY
jgi:hypothetical protein